MAIAEYVASLFGFLLIIYFGWRKVAPQLVDAGWRVVAPFMRGYAPTSLPSDGSYHVGALMDDALRVLGAAGPTGRDVLIGHDWGAIAGAGLAAMPDIATASEQGYPELIARLFVGLFAPAKTPRQILAKLEAVTQSALQDPALQAKFAAGGFETLTSSDAAAAASYINKEVARWKPLLKQFSLNQQ